MEEDELEIKFSEQEENNDKPSLFRWVNSSSNNTAHERAAEAIRQNISAQELMQQEDTKRTENMPAAVEPENQEAINQNLEEVAEKQRDLEKNQYQDFIDEAIQDPEERELVRQELNERYSVEPTEEEREEEARFFAEHGFRDEIEGDMNAKLNEQYEAQTTVPEAAESSSMTNSHSLFSSSYDQDDKENEHGETHEQATSNRLFGGEHTQDIDGGNEL